MQVCTKITSNLKFLCRRNRFLLKRERRCFVAPLFNQTSTAHVRFGIQITIRNTQFLQLALFEEPLKQGMRLEIRVQNYTAKQSFCIILVVVGRCSKLFEKYFEKCLWPHIFELCFSLTHGKKNCPNTC